MFEGIVRRRIIRRMAEKLGLADKDEAVRRGEALAKEVGKMGSKPWWQSSGIWGSLISIFALVCRERGWSLLSPEQWAAVSAWLPDAMAASAALVVAAAGSVVSIWGRLRAAKRLTVLDKPVGKPPEPKLA